LGRLRHLRTARLKVKAQAASNELFHQQVWGGVSLADAPPFLFQARLLFRVSLNLHQNRRYKVDMDQLKF